MSLRKLKRHRPGHTAASPATRTMAALLAKGQTAQQKGDLDQAITCYTKAVQLDPHHAVAVHQLGVAYNSNGDVRAAEVYYRLACDLDPKLGSARYNLGNILIHQGKIGEALSYHQQAARLEPDNVDALTNIGVALYELGKVDEAISFFERALAAHPDSAYLHSTLVSALHYIPEATPQDIFQKTGQWWEAHGRPRYRKIRYGNDPDPNRRLKVGYISPDFREHSVSYFITPLLQAHDRGQYEIYCYSDVAKPDQATATIKALADQWRDTAHVSDAALALAVENDGIDLLVDLAGHMTGNRLLVFAKKPAPVQLSWLGYPGTTGLPTIDYRLVDAVTDPPGEADRVHSEKLLRLPGCFLCYQPPDESLVPGPYPSEQAGVFTFASFNNPAKLNPSLIATWAAILRQLPNSRLLLKGKHVDDREVQRSFLASFASHGVPEAQMCFSPHLPSRRDHLALYHDVDLCLDPFPYNGTTTTLEALWMGVPVLTMLGGRHAGRVGASILNGLGRADLISANPQHYIEIAVGLASQAERRPSRLALRNQLLSSPLCDAHLFARRIEEAYRWAWHEWGKTCDSRKLG